jgi:hypothetical protein
MSTSVTRRCAKLARDLSKGILLDLCLRIAEVDKEVWAALPWECRHDVPVTVRWAGPCSVAVSVGTGHKHLADKDCPGGGPQPIDNRWLNRIFLGEDPILLERCLSCRFPLW